MPRDRAPSNAGRRSPGSRSSAVVLPGRKRSPFRTAGGPRVAVGADSIALEAGGDGDFREAGGKSGRCGPVPKLLTTSGSTENREETFPSSAPGDGSIVSAQRAGVTAVDAIWARTGARSGGGKGEQGRSCSLIECGSWTGQSQVGPRRGEGGSSAGPLSRTVWSTIADHNYHLIRSRVGRGTVHFALHSRCWRLRRCVGSTRRSRPPGPNAQRTNACGDRRRLLLDEDKNRRHPLSRSRECLHSVGNKSTEPAGAKGF